MNGKRVCFLLKVRQDRLEEYERRHQAVWPGMRDALRDSGWHDHSLFLREDGLLVGYLKTDDFEAARAAMAARRSTPAGRRRWRRSSRTSTAVPIGGCGRSLRSSTWIERSSARG
ncbi:L-rhamnose mutarotase [Actinomadura litoris]|uniref:L-rhamnose mutarotase n=1 Tax=Actinomadura litoris TaxID=2678616 RepID=UPI0035E3F4B7